MPIYEYHCSNGHQSDHLSSFDDRTQPQTCPECGELANFKQTFCTNVQYGVTKSGKQWNTTHELRTRWNNRENKRHGTKGRSYA